MIILKTTNRVKRKLYVGFLSLLAVGAYSNAQASTVKNKLFTTINNNQQNVSGVVTDASSGQALPGVSVRIKGTNQGAQSDANGRYSIVANVGQVLVVSSLGYKTIEFTVANTTANFNLEKDDQALEEIVVVGYGTMRKSDVTGSISMVKGEDMIKTQNFSAVENLRGQAAGVNIYSNSSQPGAYSNRVVIRGTNTINSSSNPLYVVDGVVMEDFHLLNPNDIDRVEVLKDASSTAIYGARGANGVILVTTKRGTKDGRKTVSYLNSVTSSSPQRLMEVLDANEWVEAFMTGLKNENAWHGKNWSLDKKTWFNDPNYFDSNGDPLYNTNWQKEATRTATSHNHQINIQQGDDKSSMGTFLNYTDHQGIVNNTFSKRVNAKMAYDSRPKDWLSTSINLTVNHIWGRYTPEDGGGQDARRTMIEMLPWYPIYDPNGEYTVSSSSTVSNVLGFEGMSNPVAILDRQKRMRYNTQIFGNAALTFHLADGLDLRTQFGVDNHARKYKGYSSTTLNNISQPRGWAELQNFDSFYWQQETYLTYNKQLDKHRINAMAGLSWQERVYNTDRSRTEGFSTDFFEWYNMGAGTLPASPTSGYDRWGMNSYFLRGGYTYNDRYSATITGRYDGSSKFGKDNKFGFFPSLGLAWNVSNEDFLANIPAISNLKIHSSIGITGNSEIAPYSSLPIIEAGTILMNGVRVPLSQMRNIPNPGLRWEETTTYDLGIDLGLFNNRLNLDVSYYNRTTRDLLLNEPIPHATGFQSVMRNVGTVRNNGFDIMLRATPIQSTNFSWNSTINMNYNKNEVVLLGNNNADMLLNGWVGGPNSIIRVGENLNSFYGFKRDGVYTIQDFENGDIAQNKIGRPKRSATAEILGKGMPDWSGSFINNVRYKQFDLLLDLQFVYGVETMQQFYHSTYDRFGITNGLKEILYGAYDGTNPNTNQQAVVLTNSGHAGQDSNVDSSWVVDGSYLRFNMVQVGYSFSSNALSKMGFSALRLYAAANNPWLITSKDFKGYDPEGTSLGENNKFGQNMVFFSYPRAKSFMIGLNLSL